MAPRSCALADTPKDPAPSSLRAPWPLADPGVWFGWLETKGQPRLAPTLVSAFSHSCLPALATTLVWAGRGGELTGP